MDVKSISMKDMILGFKRLRLPLYQRKYCWNEFHWSQLLSTLMKQTEHYIGRVFVAYIEKTTEVYVIDGQQRLTTLFILLFVLRRKLVKLLKNEENQERIKSLIKEIDEIIYVGGKSPKKKSKKKPIDFVRFLPTPKDQGSFFETMSRPKKRKKEKKEEEEGEEGEMDFEDSNALILKCQLFFEKELKSRYKDHTIPFVRAIMRLKIVLIILQERTRLIRLLGDGHDPKEKFAYRSIQEMYNEIFNISQGAAFMHNPHPGQTQKNYDQIRNCILLQVKMVMTAPWLAKNREKEEEGEEEEEDQSIKKKMTPEEKQKEFDTKYFSVLESILPREVRDDFFAYFMGVSGNERVDRFNRTNMVSLEYLKWQANNPFFNEQDIINHLTDLINKAKEFMSKEEKE